MKVDKIFFKKINFKSKYTFLVLFILLAIGINFSLKYFILQKATENYQTNASQANTANTATETESSTAKSVCLDPGHGGNDLGANYGSVVESIVNLEVALNIKSLLEARGYKVYMTRSADEFVAKRDRAYFCNDKNSDILVAIHHNSYDSDSSVNYSTALYYKDSDQALAGNILDSISSKLETKNQGIAKFDDSELWIAKMPAALSEAFFITNKTEYQALKNNHSSLLTNEAEAIANGIDNYFSNSDKSYSSVNADSLIIDRID